MPNKNMNSIKDIEKYEALREDGMSKGKAARIANTPNASSKGGKASDLEDRNKQELVNQAKKIGVKGYSRMGKPQLVDAIRNSK